ncbi:ABC transporter permease subunit [Bacillus sp. DX4.1]|uniref:ABC transporter permease n=1 Tax=Bacillus sp. DX4.1 TaxID=3055867 RepID=UPI0025A25FBE|nr:ABC transporter permease subunit [Bacillus sp. DX4.1]MDM5187239.1 ABC transporter permease subunit [Bacillus sp. DX4.1]
MWSFLKRDKRFWFGLLFLVSIVLASIGNTIWNNGEIRRVSILYDYDGKGGVLAAPFPPSWQFWLGTDRKGYDLLHLIVEGGKWTIGIALLIALLRVLFGILFGVLLGTYVKRGFAKIEAFFDSFTVIPMVMIAYFMLRSAIVFGNGEMTSSFYERASFEVILLTVLAVPTLAIYVANEVRKLFTEEFIDAARILGGSKRHIVFKHIFPHLYTSFVIVFIQQFVQALIILLHLGMLGLFFGGTIVFYGEDIDSVTHEWSGLIGTYFRSLTVHPWIPLVPIMFFGLTIFSGNIMVLSIQQAMAKARLGEGVKTEKIEETKSLSQPKEDLFTFKHTI